MRIQWTKRCIALLMALILCVGAVPATVFAEQTPAVYAAQPNGNIVSDLVVGGLKMAITKSISSGFSAIFDTIVDHSSVLTSIKDLIMGDEITMKDLDEKLDTIQNSLNSIQAQMNAMETMITKNFQEIKDILHQQDIQSEYKRITDITQMYGTLNFTQALNDYNTLSTFASKLTGEPSESDKQYMDYMMDRIVNDDLRIKSQNDCYAFYDAIQKLANVVSDCNTLGGAGVSDQPNVTGEHYEDDQTYIKAVLGKCMDSAAFSHQVFPVMAQKLGDVINGQTQMLMLYNEVSAYLEKSEDANLKAAANYLDAHYESVINLTINSINNAYEQTHLDQLMDPNEATVTLSLCNDDGVTLSNKTFYRVQILKDTFDGDIYYVQKDPEDNPFQQLQPDFRFRTSQPLMSLYNYTNGYLQGRYAAQTIGGKVVNIAQLGRCTTSGINAETGELEKGSSEIQLFSTDTYINSSAADPVDFLQGCGLQFYTDTAKKSDKANYQYVMMDAPTDSREDPFWQEYPPEWTKLVMDEKNKEAYFQFEWMTFQKHMSENTETMTSKDLYNNPTAKCLRVMKALPHEVQQKVTIAGTKQYYDPYTCMLATGKTQSHTITIPAYYMINGMTCVTNGVTKTLQDKKTYEDYANSHTYTWDLIADYDSSAYQFSLSLIPFSTVCPKGSGTAADPYIIETDAQQKDIDNLIQQGAKTEGVYFTKGALIGSGTEQDPYQISCAADLRLLSDLGNLASGKYAAVTKDMTLTDAECGNALYANLDGNGHTISITGDGWKSLFWRIYEGVEVQDLNMEVIDRDPVASIADTNYGSIRNCTATFALCVAEDGFGGIAGDNYGLIDGCKTYGRMAIIIGQAGGITCNNYGVIANSANFMDMGLPTDKLQNVCGGIACTMSDKSSSTYSSPMIYNCYNMGNIYGYMMPSGIVCMDMSTEGKVAMCYNAGTVTARTTEYGESGSIASYVAHFEKLKWCDINHFVNNYAVLNGETARLIGTYTNEETNQAGAAAAVTEEALKGADFLSQINRQVEAFNKTLASGCPAAAYWESSADVNHGFPVHRGDASRPLTQFPLGDIDNNGVWNMQDVRALFGYTAGQTELSSLQMSCADMDGDNQITMKDTMALFYKVAGNTVTP